MIAVSEAARNIACTGAEPCGVTNCLNFGNPYDPEVYWQFANVIKGMGEACREFRTPVTGGNVSFYNQTVTDNGDVAVFPTPTIGMVGVLEDIDKRCTLAFQEKGHLIFLIGKVVNDIACSEYLVDHGYTVKGRLAGTGTSAGGILIGNAMSAWPDLFRAVLDRVGMSDTLRSETEPNGPPNVSEFGSVKDEDGFHGLYGMSAYAHVRDGVAYPAVMFTTGANDPRVAPWHMMKMAARTQAATSSNRPVLLRIDYDAGHGLGSNRSQAEQQLVAAAHRAGLRRAQRHLPRRHRHRLQSAADSGHQHDRWLRVLSAGSHRRFARWARTGGEQTEGKEEEQARAHSPLQKSGLLR